MNSKVTRRDFLKKSSTGVVAAVVIPQFLGPSVSKVFAAPTGEDMVLSDYYSHFGVDEGLINGVMSEAMSRGGDYCDVYFEHSITSYVVLEDNAVNRAYSDIDYGVGIRTLKGDQTGYSFTEEITPEAMKLAAGTAANIASSGRGIEPVHLKLHKTPNYYPIVQSWEDTSIDQKVPYLMEIDQDALSRDPSFIKTRIWFISKTSYIMLATSEGRVVYDYRPIGQIYLSCTAEKGGRREQNGHAIGGRVGMEYFNREKKKKLIDTAARRTLEMFEAVTPAPGEMPVVLGAGSSGILLHEAIGHGMEADFNRKEISIFCDKVGKPVAEDFVNIIDDGTYPNARGSINVDDEGNDTESTLLVEDGILKSYLHDRISAGFYGVKSTGSGRRQSFRYPIQPRMRCTYMSNGPHTREEIIKSVDKGLYCESFTNGQVYIGAGDFTFYVKSGRMIENGRLTAPVKDINIIGNGPDVLRDIVMVADDFELAEGGGNCGKGGQYVPVSLGLPTAKVRKITIGSAG
jgi:TldD protein